MEKGTGFKMKHVTKLHGISSGEFATSSIRQSLRDYHSRELVPPILDGLD